MNKNSIEINCPFGHPVEFITKGIVFCKYCIDRRELGYYYSLSTGVHYDYDKLKNLDKPLFDTPKIESDWVTGQKEIERISIVDE